MKPVLVITKPTELTQSGNVVLGQCEPYTGGWQLMIWKSKDHAVKLLSGTYEELRALQLEWQEMDEEAVIEHARELAKTRAKPQGSTVAMPPLSIDDTEATQIIDHQRVRKAVEALGQVEEAFYLKPMQTTGGVMVLRVLAEPEEGATGGLSFGKDVPEQLRGVILAVGDTTDKELASLMGVVSLLVGRLGLGGRFVWVAAGGEFADMVERSGLNEVIRVFPTVEEALRELY